MMAAAPTEKLQLVAREMGRQFMKTRRVECEREIRASIILLV